MRKTFVAAIAAVFVSLLGVPAAAASTDVELTISPQQVTLGPEQGATQTITLSAVGQIPVYLTWTPAPPPGVSGAAIIRNGEPCQRDTNADYRCDQRGAITITYPPITDESLNGVTYELAARPEGGRRTYGSVVVVFPEPEPTSAPSPTPSHTAQPEPPTQPAAPSATEPDTGEPDPGLDAPPPQSDGTAETPAEAPSESPTATSEPSASTEPPATTEAATTTEAEQPDGGGLTTLPVLIVATGGPAAASALAALALWAIGRRRNRPEQTTAPADVTLTVEDEPERPD